MLQALRFTLGQIETRNPKAMTHHSLDTMRFQGLRVLGCKRCPLESKSWGSTIYADAYKHVLGRNPCARAMQGEAESTSSLLAWGSRQ